MAEKYLNDTGLKYYHDRVAKVKFADKTEFTTLQTRVETIANEGGEPNKIESIKLNGVVQTITGKAVDLTVITDTEVDTKITEALADITGIDFQIVTDLPSTGEKGVIYLIAAGTDAYDEYIYVNNKFELLGTTKVDLSDYVKKSDITTISTAEIDALFTE